MADANSFEMVSIGSDKVASVALTHTSTVSLNVDCGRDEGHVWADLVSPVAAAHKSSAYKRKMTWTYLQIHNTGSSSSRRDQALWKARLHEFWISQVRVPRVL